MSVIDVLPVEVPTIDPFIAEEARQVLELLRERGWCKRALVDSEGRMCLLGAIVVASEGSPDAFSRDQTPLERVIRKQIPGGMISAWNNTAERTFEDVEALLLEFGA